MKNAIKIRDLTFAYKGQVDAAIKNLSCDIPCDGIVAIIGKSGSGKSTLLRLISGVYRKQDRWSGIYKGDISICEQQPHELQGPKEVSWMGQSPFLMNNLSVRKNILLPCGLASERTHSSSSCYEGLIDSLGLSDQEHHRPMELSGGMKTRVAFARAMVSRPRYLFLDEPFTSLDIVTRWGMYKAIMEARSNRDSVTLLTTHDLWEAFILANSIIILDKKKNASSKIVAQRQNAVPDINNHSIVECLRSIQSSVENISDYLDTI